MQKSICVFLGLFLFTCGGQDSLQAAPEFEARAGVLDLRDWDPARPVELTGEWEIHPRRFLAPEAGQNSATEVDSFSIPGNWTDAVTRRGARMNRSDHATFRLRLLFDESQRGSVLSLRLPLIHSAYRLYAGERLVAEVGTPGDSVAASVPEFRILTRSFTVEDTNLVLTLHVSNFDHRKGGVSQAILLGDQNGIASLRERALFFDFILFGWLLVMGLYHLGLFLNRREDVASLLFAFVCMVVAVRILFTGENFISELWPSIAFDLRLRIEYLTYYLGAALVHSFFAVTFARRTRRYAIIIVGAITALFCVSVLFTPPLFFSSILVYYHVVTIGISIYCFTIAILGVRKKQEGALAAVVGGTVFILAVINDMLFVEGALDTGYIGALGLAVFIFAQSYALSILFASAFNGVQRLSRQLRRTNLAYSRFVPGEFLTLLNKSEITDIELGDQVQREMTMLFTDIRNFTELSEAMTPQENFNFLNSYLKRVTPVVLSEGGIIDKYIGDAIMALFTGAADDALRSGIRMQEELRAYNRERASGGYDPIQVGMGVHTGEIMLGTIGAANRMDGTVISDHVNLASRIEGLTKKFGVRMIISEATRERLQSPDDFHLRYLGEVQVRGKQASTRVYEVLDCLPEHERSARIESLERFDRGVALSHADPAQAEAIFQEIVQAHPGDLAAGWYLNRIRSDATQQG